MKLVRLKAEVFTKEGIEVLKYNREAAKEHTSFTWVYINPDYIVSIEPVTEREERVFVSLSDGNHFDIVGTPLEVIVQIQHEIEKAKYVL